MKQKGRGLAIKPKAVLYCTSLAHIVEEGKKEWYTEHDDERVKNSEGSKSARKSSEARKSLQVLTLLPSIQLLAVQCILILLFLFFHACIPSGSHSLRGVFRDNKSYYICSIAVSWFFCDYLSKWSWLLVGRDKSSAHVYFLLFIRSRSYGVQVREFAVFSASHI